MSTVQVEATALLCRLLDQHDTRINGKALFEGPWATAAQSLFRERMLRYTGDLPSATCYECWVEQARIVDDPPKSYALRDDQVLQMCPECKDIVAPAYIRKTYQPAVEQLLTHLMIGLGLMPQGVRAIQPGVVWRLGTTQLRPGQLQTWYFARTLHDLAVAQALRDHLQGEGLLHDAVIMTTSETPLPAFSPLAGAQVRSLPTVGRLGQSAFEFFDHRLKTTGAQVVAAHEQAQSHTNTLRYTASDGVVYWQGQKIKLTRQQKAILVALIDSRDHELGREALREAAGSKDEKFSPSKTFQRIPEVYHGFIHYDEEEERYALKISDEDAYWLK
jgi:hypothetical protein